MAGRSPVFEPVWSLEPAGFSCPIVVPEKVSITEADAAALPTSPSFAEPIASPVRFVPRFHPGSASSPRLGDPPIVQAANPRVKHGDV